MNVEEYAKTQLEIMTSASKLKCSKGKDQLIFNSFRAVIALLLEILANQKRHLISIGLKTSNGS